MNVNFTAPPMLRGEEAQQLAQLRDYLVAMSKQLNIALTSLDEGNFTVGSEAQRIISGGASKEVETYGEEINSLRALIRQTADDVENRVVGAINYTLEHDYVANSTYGTDMGKIETAVWVEPEGATWASTYNELIRTGLADYQLYAEGYIRAGIVEFDENNLPKWGIAVGRDIGKTTVEKGGSTYEYVTSANQRAVFTDDKLTFYQGEAPVAYMSNQKLFITAAHIIDKLQLGLESDNPKWEINMNSGFSIKWLG